jgi:hypothetical protein
MGRRVVRSSLNREKDKRLRMPHETIVQLLAALAVSGSDPHIGHALTYVLKSGCKSKVYKVKHHVSLLDFLNSSI